MEAKANILPQMYVDPSYPPNYPDNNIIPSKIASHLSDQICKQNGCAASDAHLGNNHYCQLSIPYELGNMVSLQRNDPTGAFKDCTSAFQNIISQCYQTGSDSFNPNPNGRWAVGEQWYWVTMNDTVPIHGTSEAELEEVLVGKNGQVLGETLEGPTKFCQGLSPGGGDSCIDIPVGCRITVPLYNVVPELDCSE
jgi:hypothetical protein